MPDGTRKALVLPSGLTRKINNPDRTLTLSGALSEEGDYKIEIRLTALDGSAVIKPLTIHVGTVDTGIRSVLSVATESQQAEEQVFDLLGRKRTEMKPGEIYIVRQGSKTYKVKM